MTAKPRTEAERYCLKQRCEMTAALKGEPSKPDNQSIEEFDPLAVLTLGNVVPALGSAPGDR